MRCAVGECLRVLGVLQAVVKGAALHQCAWLLHIAALQLHRADMALPAHREDCQTLLQAFFGVPQDSDGDGVPLALTSLFEKLSVVFAGMLLMPMAPVELARL